MVGEKGGGLGQGLPKRGDALMKKDREKDFVCVFLCTLTNVYVFQVLYLSTKEQSFFSIL